MTLTLGSLITTIVGTVTDVVPDFEIFIAGGVVISLAAYTVRRFIGAGL